MAAPYTPRQGQYLAYLHAYTRLHRQPPSEAEILEFLFLPGFSTAEKVTEISGRGVGLDVVQTMIQEVSGQIRVTTRPGAGGWAARGAMRAQTTMPLHARRLSGTWSCLICVSLS